MGMGRHSHTGPMDSPQEICTMEMIMHCLKLREAQMDKRRTINVTEQRQNTGLDSVKKKKDFGWVTLKETPMCL